MESYVTCKYCGNRELFQSFCPTCGSRLVSPRNYKYKCCDVEWFQDVEYDNRDSVVCDNCGKYADRLLTAANIHRNQMPLSPKEKGIKKDLVEANDIEKSLAYGDLAKAAPIDKIRANQEVKKLKGV